MTSRKAASTLFGLTLIAAGAIWALTVLGVITFDFSLKGWWAFLVILPCVFGLFTDKEKIGSLMGIVIGVLLLLSARDVITWAMFGQLALATLVIGMGASILFWKGRSQKETFKMDTISREGKTIHDIEFSFGKQNLTFGGEKFEGADIKTSFGTLHLDLKNAIIEDDVQITVDAAFSGIVIYVPENLVVKTAVSCGFGGVTDNRYSKPVAGSPVLFITGQAGFAGVEIK